MNKQLELDLKLVDYHIVQYTTYLCGNGQDYSEADIVGTFGDLAEAREHCAHLNSLGGRGLGNYIEYVVVKDVDLY